MTTATYREKDLVVRPEGRLFRVVRSRFHAAGDLITKTELDGVRCGSLPGKVLVLPDLGGFRSANEAKAHASEHATSAIAKTSAAPEIERRERSASLREFQSRYPGAPSHELDSWLKAGKP